METRQVHAGPMKDGFLSVDARVERHHGADHRGRHWRRRAPMLGCMGFGSKKPPLYFIR